MKLIIKRRSSHRLKARQKNKARIRKKVNGTGERPRLTIYRSGKHMYAQIVDDAKQTTLVALSTQKLNVKSKASCEGAKALGEALAKKAIEKDIKAVVFDRSGYVYHGRVKALADGAREGGLNF